MTRALLVIGIGLHGVAIVMFCIACALPAVALSHGEHLLGYQTIVAGPLAAVGCAEPRTLGLPWIANAFACVGPFTTLAGLVSRRRAPIFLAAAGNAVAVLCTIPVLFGMGDDALMCLDACAPILGYETGAYVWVASVAVLPVAALVTAFGVPPGVDTPAPR